MEVDIEEDLVRRGQDEVWGDLVEASIWMESIRNGYSDLCSTALS